MQNYFFFSENHVKMQNYFMKLKKKEKNIVKLFRNVFVFFYFWNFYCGLFWFLVKLTFALILFKNFFLLNIYFFIK